MPVIAMVFAGLSMTVPVQAATAKPAAAVTVTINFPGVATRGKPMTVKATVKPVRKKGLVALQYHTPTGWKRIATARQNGRGQALLVSRPKASGTMTLRALTFASKGRLAAHSITRKRHVFPTKSPQIIAHRGLSATEPENTIGSYRAALRAHADAVETDIRRTKDGELVLLHDATLARTTDVETKFPERKDDRVETFTLAELGHLDFGAWKGAVGTKVATLNQLLDLLDGKDVRLIAEIKLNEQGAADAGMAKQIVDALKEHGMIQPGYGDRVEIISYDSAVLHEARKLSRYADVGFVSPTAIPDLASWTWVNTLHLKYKMVDAAQMTQAREFGIEVVAWTVDGKPDAYSLADLGVEGITTNVTDALRPALVP